MVRLIALCSGGGGTIKSLHKILNAKLETRENSLGIVVIADRPCGALKWAEKADGVDAMLIDWERDQNKLVKLIRTISPTVVLTLIHRILGRQLLELNEVKFINTHYSLLPSFQGSIGMKSLKRAVDSGCCVYGATTHLATVDLDAGPIVAQVAFARKNSDSIETMEEAMFISGCLSTYAGLLDAIEYKEMGLTETKSSFLSMKGREYIIAPAISIADAKLLSSLR